MALKTIDPKKVILTIGGVPIGGYADGTFISFEMAEDAFTTSVGADGETVRVKSNNRLGTLTITLQQTSDSNSSLSAVATADQLSGTGIVAVLIKEIGGDTSIISGKGWVRKLPVAEYGKEVANREWILDLADVDAFIGGTFGFLV